MAARLSDLIAQRTPIPYPHNVLSRVPFYSHFFAAYWPVCIVLRPETVILLAHRKILHHIIRISTLARKTII